MFFLFFFCGNALIKCSSYDNVALSKSLRFFLFFCFFSFSPIELIKRKYSDRLISLCTPDLGMSNCDETVTVILAKMSSIVLFWHTSTRACACAHEESFSCVAILLDFGKCVRPGTCVCVCYI